MGLEESELHREEIGKQWGLQKDSGADICQRSQATQVKVGPSEGPDRGNGKDFLTQVSPRVPTSLTSHLEAITHQTLAGVPRN